MVFAQREFIYSGGGVIRRYLSEQMVSARNLSLKIHNLNSVNTNYMKRLLLTFAILFPLFSNAQVGEDAFQYILGDNVNVRDQPNTSGKKIAKLQAGDGVHILEQTDGSLRVDGLDDYWLKVEFKLNGAFQSGYIWGGLVSDQAQEVSDGAMFLAGTRKWTEDDGFLVRCMVVKDHEILAQIDLSAGMGWAEETHFFSLYPQLMYKMEHGFPQFSDVLILSMSPEACGVVGYDYALFYKEKQLIAGPVGNSVSEAGLFYSDESFIFPADSGGVKNQLLVVQESAEVEGEDEDYPEPTITVRPWRFTGTGFTQIKEED